MTYYGIFQDGNFIKKDNLDDLTQVPGIEYYFKVESPCYNTYTYTLVKPTGEINFIKVGDFELRDIGTEFYDKNEKAHKSLITVYEYRTKKTVQESIFTNSSPQKALIGVMNFLNQLNEFGSFDMYRKSLEFEELKRENKSLKEKISILESRL